MRRIHVGHTLTGLLLVGVAASWLVALGGCADVPPNPNGAPITFAQRLGAEQAVINQALANGTSALQFACMNAQTGLVKLQTIDPHWAQSILQHNSTGVSVAQIVCSAVQMVPSGTQPPALVPPAAPQVGGA